jgi:serine/threonine protein kinase
LIVQVRGGGCALWWPHLDKGRLAMARVERMLAAAQRKREEALKGSSEEEAAFFFQRFDATGDEMLDFAEFAEAVEEIGLLAHGPEEKPAEEADAAGETPQDILAEMRATRPLLERLKPSLPVLRREFALADVDGDGVLTYLEWVAYYTERAGSCRTPFAEAYEIHATIGSGAFGTVCRGVQRSSGKPVAVKQVAKSMRTDRKRIRAEIAIWEGLRHPHLLTLLDVHETPTKVLLVTEFCEGGDLFEAIGRVSRFTELQAATLGRQIVSAVAHLHEHGIVHADLKPANILIVEPPPHGAAAGGPASASAAIRVAGRRFVHRLSKRLSGSVGGTAARGGGLQAVRQARNAAKGEGRGGQQGGEARARSAKVVPAPPPSSAKPTVATPPVPTSTSTTTRTRAALVTSASPPMQMSLKLADFGLSKLRPAAQMWGTVSGPGLDEQSTGLLEVAGTPLYYAPELARLAGGNATRREGGGADGEGGGPGREQAVGPAPLKKTGSAGYGSKVDDWAVGCVVYEMLVGAPPFRVGRKESEASLYDQIARNDQTKYLHLVPSEEAREVVRAFLTTDPNDRLSCSAALKHPWFGATEEGVGGTAVDRRSRALPASSVKRRERTRRQRRSGEELGGRLTAAAELAQPDGSVKASPLTPLPLTVETGDDNDDDKGGVAAAEGSAKSLSGIEGETSARRAVARLPIWRQPWRQRSHDSGAALTPGGGEWSVKSDKSTCSSTSEESSVGRGGLLLPIWRMPWNQPRVNRGAGAGALGGESIASPWTKGGRWSSIASPSARGHERNVSLFIKKLRNALARGR